MSDGPFRSLPLRPCWKKVAEFAENPAFSTEEVCSALPPALVQDWKEDQVAEIAARVCSIFDDQQGSLFRQDRVTALEDLLASAAGSGLGQVLIDCAIRRAVGGASGDEGAALAVEDALRVWASRHTRPIEEHYCREWDAPRAREVRARIEEGFSGTAFEALARQLLGKEGGQLARAPLKQSGLDDGVQL